MVYTYIALMPWIHGTLNKNNFNNHINTAWNSIVGLSHNGIKSREMKFCNKVIVCSLDWTPEKLSVLFSTSQINYTFDCIANHFEHWIKCDAIIWINLMGFCSLILARRRTIHTKMPTKQNDFIRCVDAYSLCGMV